MYTYRLIDDGRKRRTTALKVCSIVEEISLTITWQNTFRDMHGCTWSLQNPWAFEVTRLRSRFQLNFAICKRDRRSLVWTLRRSTSENSLIVDFTIEISRQRNVIYFQITFEGPSAYYYTLVPFYTGSLYVCASLYLFSSLFCFFFPFFSLYFFFQFQDYWLGIIWMNGYSDRKAQGREKRNGMTVGRDWMFKISL